MKIDQISVTRIAGNSPEEISIIAKSEGLWLCIDSNKPEGLIPLIAQGGKVYAVTRAQELSIEGFYPSAQFVGPFTAEDVIGK